MDNKKKWTTPQSIIIMAIVLLIFVYIGLDLTKTKPAIKSDLESIKKDYTELSGFLDKKLPAIDSTLVIQAEQISEQSASISILNDRVGTLSPSE